MKTLLTLFVLFLSSISFNSYGGWFDKTICVETDVQIRGDIIYLPNETKPFTGKNLCNYENGQIKSQGKFKDGIKDDEWTLWNKNSQINSEINFKQGIKFNETIYVYNKNGQLRSEENYKEGILIGESINSYYENGQIEWKENYKDNKLEGKVTFWSENGEIEHEATFKKSKCTSGECNLVACFKNFNILDDKIISLPNETEPFTGINLCKYENGQIEIQIKIKDGMLYGKYKQWNENGQIVLDANFKDNTVHGNYTEWWSN